MSDDWKNFYGRVTLGSGDGPVVRYEIEPLTREMRESAVTLPLGAVIHFYGDFGEILIEDPDTPGNDA